MFRYLLLNAIVLACLASVLVFSKVKLQWRLVCIVLIIMLLLTAVFDNIIIAAGLVAYDSQFILGITAGLAPIEDFAYTIAAIVIVILVWERADHAHNS